jgi:hypothetical protein
MIGRRLVKAAALCVLAAATSVPGVRYSTGGFPLEQKSLAQAQSGVVYVGSNIGHATGKNSILAYQRDGSGKLTALKIGANGQIAEQTDRVVLSVAPSFAQGVIAR